MEIPIEHIAIFAPIKNMNMKLLFSTTFGDQVYFYEESAIIHLAGKRNLISTCNLNGGYREDIQYIFNNSCGRKLMSGEDVVMVGNNMRDHYIYVTEELKLPVESTTGLCTAALMENMAVVSESYKNVDVTAIVTAGIDINGGRAGDVSQFDEFEDTPSNTVHGTINIFLLIDALLDAGTLTRAVVTVTEAKTAVLQELMANSVYSEGLATGSGTDGVVVIGNMESDIYLYNAGKHCMLGELIGRTVKQAVREALSRQSGMNADRQASIAWQNLRYSITEKSIYETYLQIYPQTKDKTIIRDRISLLVKDNDLVARIASIIHLIDQNKWGLLTDTTLLDTATEYLNLLRKKYKLATQLSRQTEKETYQFILKLIKQTLAEIAAIY